MAIRATEESLKKHGWSDLLLRPYQLEGVNWLLGCHDNGHGCILGDEMGLGKTCQTIAMLALRCGEADKGPHLVVCPRSVLENWVQEFHRFAPSLRVQTLIGDKEKRGENASEIKRSRQNKAYRFDVMVTTYEICLKDYLFLQSLPWQVLVVDEGHRLKNSESLLYRTLEQWDICQRVLLTGTPVQNNLGELFSLLSFVHPDHFRPSKRDSFVDKYSSTTKEVVEELHGVLKPYLLRRTKSGVLADLPGKSDVVLYHGISPLQKKLYKAILMKDIGVFENAYGTGQTRLMNILMQLRKCVNHPYLFDGVEPEPFQLGEHLVTASAKLVLIDRLLSWLSAKGHKVLLFSQMTAMLDILQDYLALRGYTYERLDGSVRGEERFLAVENFNKNAETFVFLLSTRAGGQGLNLTAADTVIFVDSDFNPQNDLQAAARAHRIGQHRPVKVLRLVGRNTVEEMIMQRADAKLRLTDTVIEKGEFTSADPAASTSKASLSKTSSQLQEILKFGMDKLLNEDAQDEAVDFSAILGPSRDGCWQADTRKEEEDVMEEEDKEEETEKKEKDEEEEEEEETPQSMYVFEGQDYKRQTKATDTAAADAAALKTLVELRKAEEEDVASGERSLRKRGSTLVLTGLLPEFGRKPRKQLSPEELEARKLKRKEAAEKRAQKAKEEKQKKKEALYKKYSYKSVSIVIDSEDEEEEEEEEESDERGEEEEEEGRRRAINFVMDDVTKPGTKAGTGRNIIVHCTDDSGYWGRGGLFSAISARSSQPKTQYELAGTVDDLSLGDCHLVSIEASENGDKSTDMVALIVAQTRDRQNRLSGIKLGALKSGLEKVQVKARQLKASVHLPRIGRDTPGFNWYGTERLIKKTLASRGIPTYIYYFPRKQAAKRRQPAPASPPPKAAKVVKDDEGYDDNTDELTDEHDTPSPSPTKRQSEVSPSTRTPGQIAGPSSDEDFLSGVAIHLAHIPNDAMTHYKRQIVTYDGDVDSYVHGSTTHLVVAPGTDQKVVKKVLGNHSCCVVTSEWLDQCLQNKKLVSTDPFSISKS